MRYFTPELIVRLNSTDPADADAADAEWDGRQEAYEQELRRIEPTLPEHVRAFNELLLHDARVYSLARQGDQLIMVLRKDVPPRDLVIVTYGLVAEPVIDTEALPAGEQSPVMDFLYLEFAVLREGDAVIYEQAMLFGNGWEVRLRFRDVRVVLAEPLFAGNAPVPWGRLRYHDRESNPLQGLEAKMAKKSFIPRKPIIIPLPGEDLVSYGDRLLWHQLGLQLNGHRNAMLTLDEYVDTVRGFYRDAAESNVRGEYLRYFNSAHEKSNMGFRTKEMPIPVEFAKE